MSVSPPKETDVEPAGAPSPDTSEHMDRGDAEGQARELAYEFEVKEQDRWLPIANVARIMKTALPENAKIAKEAKECMQECVSEFISFITSEASEKCQQEKRKTVNGEDILFAMTSLGFENYADALKIYLIKYRETQQSRGENQGSNRPGSGYGQPGSSSSAGAAPGGSGGPAGGPSGGTQSAYQPQGESSDSNLIAAQLQDPGQQPGNPFAPNYPPGGSHGQHGNDPSQF